MACADDTGIILFSENTGKVVAVDGFASPFVFSVDGDFTLFNDLKGIVTSVGIQAQSGFQFMHALREFIYVYVFTERIGEIVINGMVFPEYCGFEGPQGIQIDACEVEGQTGLERLIKWYECNRITSRASPITIGIGTDIFYDAFCVGMKADIASQSSDIAQFSLRFNFVPNIVDGDELCYPFEDNCDDAPCDEEEDEE